MRITRNLPGVITNCEGPTTIIRHKKPLRSYGDKRSEGWGKESRRILKDVEETWILTGYEACQSVSVSTVMRIRKNLPGVIKL